MTSFRHYWEFDGERFYERVYNGVPDVGHYSPEDPDACVDRIIDWLSTSRSTPDLLQTYYSIPTDFFKVIWNRYLREDHGEFSDHLMWLKSDESWLLLDLVTGKHSCFSYEEINDD